jgi:hypothetical protein
MTLETTNLWLVQAKLSTSISAETSISRLVCASDAVEAVEKFRTYCEELGVIHEIEATPVLF